ncbi:MAG: flagellar biosynthetic protein FliR [Pseudomonadota bacterium]
MPLSEAALLAGLHAFARIAGWALFDPLAGRLPVYLRLLLAVALAAVLAPGLALPPTAALGISTLLSVLLEAAWGAALALCVWLVFALAQVALQWLGHTATGGLLALTDAQGQDADAPWRALAGWLAALAFLGASGHLLVVSALRDSFAAMPVAMLPTPDNLLAFAQAASWLFAVGMQLALPLLALALLIQLALGVIARTTPGLDMLSAGLGIAALALMGAWIVAVPWIAQATGGSLVQLTEWFGVLIAR